MRPDVVSVTKRRVPSSRRVCGPSKPEAKICTAGCFSTGSFDGGRASPGSRMICPLTKSETYKSSSYCAMPVGVTCAGNARNAGVAAEQVAVSCLASGFPEASQTGHPNDWGCLEALSATVLRMLTSSSGSSAILSPISVVAMRPSESATCA